MSTLSSKLAVICLITATSMVMYGCGGGGGGSSDDTANGGGEPPATCPEGQTGTPPNCMVPGPTDEEIEAATKAAESKTMAIAEEANESGASDEGLGGNAAATLSAGDEGYYSLSISATEVEVTITGDPDGDPVVPDTKFEATNVSDGLTMHTYTKDAVEEIVMVSTDIEAPTDIPFAVDGDNMGRYTLDTNPDPEDSSVNRSLSIADSNLSMVSGVSEFPSAASQTAIAFDENAEFSGMFDGAPGTYTCASSGCAVSTNSDGALSTIAGTWHFTPSRGATVSEPDGDYLHYGFWLKRTKDSDGVVTYNEVETFAGHSLDNSTTDVSSVTGTAEYSGSALGVYVSNNEYSSEHGGLINASSGHFTADVSLTVTFGQVNDDQGEGTIAPNLLNTLTGAIDNFMLSGGEENSWSVTLSDADISDGVSGDNWNANFYGPVTDGEDPVAPHTIVGEFNSVFDKEGSVAGAFGARKE